MSNMVIMDLAKPTSCSWCKEIYRRHKTLFRPALMVVIAMCMQGCAKQKPTDIIGFLDTPGNASDVVVDGSTAFVADGYGGLHLIDISDPSSPKIIVTVGVVKAKSVFVSMPFVYVAGHGTEDLSVVEVRSAAKPDIAAKIKTPGFARDVFISGSTAFVADRFNTGGLSIIDVSTPKRPFLVKSLYVNNAQGLFVSGATAYLACGFDGLKIVDVKDPHNPVLTGKIKIPGLATKLWVAGKYVLVASAHEGIQVVDVAHPSGSKIVSAIDTSESANDIVVRQDIAFVANGKKGLMVIDVSDMKNTRILKSVDTPGAAQAVAVSGEYAYIADGFSGLQIISLKTGK